MGLMNHKNSTFLEVVGKISFTLITFAPLQALAIPQSLSSKEAALSVVETTTTLTFPSPSFSQVHLAQTPDQNHIQQLLAQGTQHYQARQFKLAIQTWQQALSLLQKSEDLSQQALVLGRLGLAHQNLGDPEQAIRYFNQALPLLRQTGEQATTASVLGNLGNNYLKVGNYAEAIAAYDQSIQLWKYLKDLNSEGQARRGLGNVYITLGQYSKALEQHQQGLTIALGSNSPNALANAYNSLGVIYLNLTEDNHKQARQYFLKSLNATQNIKDSTQRQSLQIPALHNLGNVELSQGDKANALNYYQQGLANAQAINDKRQEVSALQGISSLYTSQNKNSAALTILRQSLTLLKNLNSPQLEATHHHLMGSNLWKLGQLSEAEIHFKSAVNLLDELRTELPDIAQVSMFDTQIHSYALLRRVLAEQGKVEEALEASERGRARAFIKLLDKRRAVNSSPSAPIKSQLPNLEELRQVAKQQNATLVEYAYIADETFVAHGKRHGSFIKIYIWVVQPNGTISFRDIDLSLDQSQLLTQAGQWANDWGNVRKLSRTAQQQEKTLKQDFQQLHQDLYQILIAPIADSLPTDPTSPIIFIPYRDLFQVSFPALQAPDGTYLIQNHTILTAPAIQVLALNRNPKKRNAVVQPTNALIVGNPKMPVLSSHALGSLPRSESEALTISKILNTQALINEAATETVIKQRIGSAQLVHFATHGLLDTFENGSVPGENSSVPGAIVLAPGEGKGNSGLLTSDEILDLELNADLVVVSACDTGRGLLTGDGVIGLSRSIMATGVPNVIITLWEIQDDSTAVLMSEFYRHYVQTGNKAQSLRKAMLKTMEQHPHPVNWAPFTLVGQAE